MTLTSTLAERATVGCLPAEDIVETGWNLAIVLDDEPRAISALSVYRALLADGTAGGLDARVLLGDR